MINSQFVIVFYLILLIGFSLALLVFKKYFQNSLGLDFRRYRSKSIMTPAEQRCFLELERKYGQEYYIFPQVNLGSLVEVTEYSKDYRYRNRIDKKSVDYVLVNKFTFKTEKVIELDDWSHLKPDRQNRDKFVNELLKKCEITLERMKT